jgi:hypothetical protein
LPPLAPTPGSYPTSSSSLSDFCTGEGSEDPQGMDGLLTPESNGRYPSGTHGCLQASVCLIAESTWVHDRLNTAPAKPRWNADQLTRMFRSFIARRNVPILNLEITQDGHFSPETIALSRRWRKVCPETRP